MQRCLLQTTLIKGSGCIADSHEGAKNENNNQMPGLVRSIAAAVAGYCLWLLADPDLLALRLHAAAVSVDHWSAGAHSHMDSDCESG